MTEDSAKSPEHRVREGLQELEDGFRSMVLLALADWSELALPCPETFPGIAALQRPSWGPLNGLLTALLKARRRLLRQSGPELRERIAGAVFVARLSTHLSATVEPELASALAPLAALTRSPSGRLTEHDLLAMPIALRNRVAHDAPADPIWWEEADAALKPLLAAHRERELVAALRESEAWPEPWFYQREGVLWSLHGLSEDFEGRYRGPGGEERSFAESRPALLSALGALLGDRGGVDEDLKLFLGRLAPEEIKGVMLGEVLVGPCVGEGGFATVHKGRLGRSGRAVAVKILRDGLPQEARDRFENEARLLGRLDHPGIVRVLGFGEDRWIASRAYSLEGEEWYESVFKNGARSKTYMILDWIEGETLNAIFKKAERLPERSITGLFAQAAESLAAVHARGLVHRDLKPGNLMRRDDGRLILMDFGIADFIEDSESRGGASLGTPAYMSPEQLRAEAEGSVGPATDIYSLCATFYELYTGRRLFFHDSEPAEVVRAARLEGRRPERPGALEPELSWAIETILMGGLEPEVGDRYASAEALRQDLARSLRDEPILYRQPSVLRRAALAYRRNKGLARAALAVTAAGLIGLTIYLAVLIAKQRETAAEGQRAVAERSRLEAQARRRTAAALEASEQAKAARDKAREEELRAKEAEAARREASRRLGQLHWLRGYQELERDRGERALPFLASAYALLSPSSDLRVMLGATLREQQQLVQTIPDCGGELRGLALSPDGSRLAAAIDGEAITVWSRSGALLRRLELREEYPSSYARIGLRFAGDHLVSMGLDSKTHIWELATGALVAALDSADGAVVGDRLFLCRSKEAVILRIPDGAVQDRLAAPDKDFACAGARADGEAFALGARSGALLVWTPGAPPRRLGDLKSAVEDVALSPDGRFLAAMSRAEGLSVWRLEDGTSWHREALPDRISYRLRYSPDGAYLAVDSAGIKVWDTGSFRRREPAGIRRLSGNNFQLGSGGQLFVSGTDSSGEGFSVVERWDLPSQQLRWSYRSTRASGQQRLALSASGSLLAVGGEDRRIALCEPLVDNAPRELSPPLNRIEEAAFGPEGRYLVLQASDRLRLRDLERGKELLTRVARRPVWAFDSTRERFALCPGDGELALYELPSGELLWRRSDAFGEDGDKIRKLRFSADSGLLAAAVRGRAQLFDGGSGADGARFYGHVMAVDDGALLDLAFARRSKRLLTVAGAGSGAAGGAARFWSIADRRLERSFLDPESAIIQAELGPRGSRLAILNKAGSVRIADAQKGGFLGALKSKLEAQRILWSGQRLLVFADDRVEVWDPTRPRALASLKSASYRPQFAVASDGSLLLFDGQLYSTERGWKIAALPVNDCKPRALSLQPAKERVRVVAEDGRCLEWTLPVERRPAAELAADVAALGRWRLDRAGRLIRSEAPGAETGASDAAGTASQDNRGPQGALQIKVGVHEGLRLGGDDLEDWFRFEAGASDALRLIPEEGSAPTMEVFDASGALLRRVDPGRFVLGEAPPFSFLSPKSGRYWLRVAANPLTRVAITYQLILGPLKEDPRLRFEPNDSLASARLLNPGEHKDIERVGEDWYRVELPASSALTVALAFPGRRPNSVRYSADGEATIALVDSSATIRGRAAWDQTGQRLRFATREAGIYYLKVGPWKQTWRYELRLAIERDIAFADLFEPNDSAASAARILPGTYENLVLEAEDYYRVEVPAGSYCDLLVRGKDGGAAPSVMAIDDQGMPLHQKSWRSLFIGGALQGRFFLRCQEKTRLLFRARGFKTRYSLRLKIVGPDDSGVYVKRGRELGLAGELMAAAFELELALRLDPGSIEAWALQSRISSASGRFGEASTQAEKAIALGPERPEGYTARAMLHRARQDTERALRDLDRALELDPKHLSALANRASLRASRSELKEAEADCDRYLALDQSDPQVYVLRGAIRLYTRRFAEALADCEAALKLAPKLAAGYNLRSQTREALGQIDGAIADLEVFLELAGSGPQAGAARRRLIALKARKKGQ